MPRRQYNLAIERRSDGQMIGVTKFTPHSAWEGEVGYFLERPAWGNGHATEAVKGLVNAAFAQLRVHRVWATCAPENLASARVLEKLGMRREGHLRRHFPMQTGWRDSYLYAVLEDEWGRST